MFARSVIRSKRLLIFGIGLLAFAAAAIPVFWNRLDLARYRADPSRLAKLRHTPLLNLTGPSPALDWPQWRGPHRDGLSRETGLLQRWPEAGPRLLWQVPVGRGFSAPVISAGRVFTMMQESPTGVNSSAGETQEVVACWDAETGQPRWRFGYPNRYEERFGSGPRSTPAVDGDFLYAVGPTGIFHCLGADTGARVWRHDLLAEFATGLPQYGVSFSPLVEGNLVIVTPGGAKSGTVVAFDKFTGKQIWKALDEPMGYSSPVMTEAGGVRQLLVLTNKSLVGLRPEDGQVLWQYPWEARGGFNIATPIPLGNYVFVSSGYGKGCALVEISAAADGSLHTATVYENNRMRNYFSSSVHYKGHVYGFDNAELACLDVRTGKVVWRDRGRRGFKKGSLMIADGHLLILGEDGLLALAEATPEGYREKSSFAVSAHKCWTMPILAAGRLYVRDEGRLACLSLRR